MDFGRMASNGAIFPYAWGGELAIWLMGDDKNSLYDTCSREYFPAVATYEGTVSIQAACALLDADSEEMVIIYNGFFEITDDPEFNGEVCSIEGVLY